MKPWPGHLPITRLVVFTILNRAAVHESDFSDDERMLCTACEFWAAVAAGELSDHLGSQPAARLRTAGIALRSLGAEASPRHIFTALDELRNLRPGVQCDEAIVHLARQLQATDESIDELLGLFATRCLSVMEPFGLTPVNTHHLIARRLQ